MPRGAAEVAEFVEPDEITFNVLSGRLSKDVKEAAVKMNRRSARYIVDCYYQLQQFRKASDNMQRAAEAAGEPTEVVEWFAGVHGRMENTIKGLLGKWAENSLVGSWCMSQFGVGPVISAGLLAHLDIDKVAGVGQIWSFAGLNPTVSWEKGCKIPWNAALKTLCWKLSSCFLKFKARPQCVYGRAFEAYWLDRKRRNENKQYAELAAATLTKKKFTHTATKTLYEEGTLPDGRILLQAQRWIAKMFLSHWFWVAWEAKHGTPAPLPYIFRDGGHRDLWAPPLHTPLPRNDGPQVRVHTDVDAFLHAQGYPPQKPAAGSDE